MVVFKLLGLWIDDNLKWQTNTGYIIGKAVKRLFLLKILKKYGADKNDMKRLHISAIRPILEYGAQVWHGGLTKTQSSSIEKVQRKALRIIYSEKDYEKLLLEAGMHTLEQRRNTMCIDLISKISDPQHKLHHLLPNKLCHACSYGEGIHVRMVNCFTITTTEQKVFDQQSNCFVN